MIKPMKHLLLTTSLLTALLVQNVNSQVEDESDTIGLALPLGSFTGAVVGASVMRGFHLQKATNIDGEISSKSALEMFDYMTGSSGGLIPNIMFAYARDRTSDELLDAGGINDPKDITAEELDNIPDKSIFKIMTSHSAPSFLKAIVSAAITGKTLFSEFMYFQCLEPVGVPKDQPLEDTPLRDGVNYIPIVTTNMHGPIELDPNWFYEVMNVHLSQQVAMLSQNYEEFQFMEGSSEARTYRKLDIPNIFRLAEEGGHQIPIPGFITPDMFYVGYSESEMEFSSVAGLSAESLSFSPFSTNPDALQPEEEGAMTIEKFLGLGTNAVPIMLPNFMDDLPQALIDLFSKPLVQEITTADGQKRTVPFTDGGLVTLAGIPALVKKDTKKIIFPIMRTDAQHNVLEHGPVMTALFRVLLPLFGLVSEHEMDAIVAGTIEEYNVHLIWDYLKAVGGSETVFDPMSNGENQLDKFYAMAKALYDAGEPIVVTLENLHVVENPFWAIEAGGLVDLTIILILDVPENFSKQIDPNVAPPPEGKSFTENGFFTNEDLKFVPAPVSAMGTRQLDLELPLLNLTVHQEAPDFDFSVNPKACKMTEVLVTWIINEAWEGLSDANGVEVFSGFKNIFVANETDSDNDGPAPREVSDSFDTIKEAVKEAIREMKGEMKEAWKETIKEVLEEHPLQGGGDVTAYNHYFYAGANSAVNYGDSHLATAIDTHTNYFYTLANSNVNFDTCEDKGKGSGCSKKGKKDVKGTKKSTRPKKTARTKSISGGKEVPVDG